MLSFDAFPLPSLPSRFSISISPPLGAGLLLRVSSLNSSRRPGGRWRSHALPDGLHHDGNGDLPVEPKRVVRVPRHEYIPVSKADLLDAILTNMFADRDDAVHFSHVSSCLDAILHAEHKSILERMRADYGVVSAHLHDQRVHDQLIERFESGSEDGVDQDGKWEDKCGGPKESSDKHSRNGDRSSVSVATRFQRNFLQLLLDAQFEELSVKDLLLTSALNTDYLLTLPIYIDWKRASEANAIIFRRGYATERQTGLLLADKLDYLQSKFLRGIFSGLSKPLRKLGTMIMEGFENNFSIRLPEDLVQALKKWLLDIPDYQISDIRNGLFSYNSLEEASEYGQELPMWLAAQRAVTRYEGILSPSGPRGRLLRRLLAWTGLVPPMREAPFELEDDNDKSEPHLRPIALSRVSLNDVWRPASSKSCGNDLWKMLKVSISILFSQSTLEEAAFEELVLLYTEKVDQVDAARNTRIGSLQLKIYERIPIPDLPVVFPHKKLSFRIIDTLRLDIATLLGLLAYIINYKFEDILSSPSAIFLDAVAASALVIFVSRVVLGYKQTSDRYQLLVNKTLYERTLASGFGSVHFLLDASEQQQYKEAILTYAVLINEKTEQVDLQKIADECERFMYHVLKKKVKMPVEKAMKMLIRLGLASEARVDGNAGLQAVPVAKACESLKDRWNSMLS
ncbi:hypothetical protein MLD38_018220 [Melastoma candidum]|uniref:Uncharacterized protein n=1 Tax=Melastoma candidum TaxID=119954 RepID=A0ACB9R1E1_9MYRT|nr:hypothetical protein MLD38_018220 [Melastoma candidum]